MEGVTDAPMRATLSELGGFSYCVTEFFRISQDVPYVKAFHKHVPELAAGSVTPSGVPVQVQLLGGNAEKLALSAIIAVEAGATGIDINFGCPAPTVNRNDGGATLLKYPERIRSIVGAVRSAVKVPVSAKLRLGWEDMNDIHRNAEAAAEGGAMWLTIHGRTKAQGYRPPAHWEPIGEIRARLGIPIVANGDIWTLDDFKRCRDVTGCKHFMFGRSALGNPWLAQDVARELGIRSSVTALSDRQWLPLLFRFQKIADPYGTSINYVLCRMKQWLKMTPLRSSELNTSQSIEEFFARLAIRLERRETPSVLESGSRLPLAQPLAQQPLPHLHQLAPEHRLPAQLSR